MVVMMMFLYVFFSLAAYYYLHFTGRETDTGKNKGGSRDEYGVEAAATAADACEAQRLRSPVKKGGGESWKGSTKRQQPLCFLVIFVGQCTCLSLHKHTYLYMFGDRNGIMS